MRFIFLLFIGLPGALFAKQSKPVPTSPAVLEAALEVESFMNLALQGKVTNEDCDENLSVTRTDDWLQATVNGENYYIVLREVTIEGVLYNPSRCSRYDSSRFVENTSTVQMECAAHPVVSDDELPPAEVLVFYMHYVYSEEGDLLKKCPSVGQIAI